MSRTIVKLGYAGIHKCKVHVLNIYESTKLLDVVCTFTLYSLWKIHQVRNAYRKNACELLDIRNILIDL